MRRGPSSVIIAGLGAMGGGLLRLGGEYLKNAGKVTAFDKNPATVSRSTSVKALVGEADDEGFLKALLKGQPAGFLFVNLLSGADNLKIRELVAQRGGNYIDTGAGFGGEEGDFIGLMEKSWAGGEDVPAQLLFCGVNPGMVEIVARAIARESFRGDDGPFDVEIYEKDTISSSAGKVFAASWSPETLAEEMLLTPTVLVRDGFLTVEKNAEPLPCDVWWGKERRRARLVAHEELWTLCRKAPFPIGDSFFAYSLSRRAMKALERAPMPAGNIFDFHQEPVAGYDEVLVKVRSRRSGREEARSWRSSHREANMRFGVNAVQFQVVSSVLFFLRFADETKLWAKKGLYCGSNLPIEGSWGRAITLWKELGISWRKKKRGVRRDSNPAN